MDCDNVRIFMMILLHTNPSSLFALKIKIIISLDTIILIQSLFMRIKTIIPMTTNSKNGNKKNTDDSRKPKVPKGSLESDHRERKAMEMETQIPEGGTNGSAAGGVRVRPSARESPSGMSAHKS